MASPLFFKYYHDLRACVNISISVVSLCRWRWSATYTMSQPAGRWVAVTRALHPRVLNAVSIRKGFSHVPTAHRQHRKNDLGTSYSPPVKCKSHSLKLQDDTCRSFFKTHVAPASCSDSIISSTIFSHKANLLSERYSIRRAVAAKHPLSRFSSSMRGPVLSLTRSCASTLCPGLSTSKSYFQSSIRPIPYYPLG